jgi:DNA polymerase (family X)
MTNTAIAQTLESYAALLDLAGAGYYTVRAYRRAAELVRETRAPVAELVRAGRARELRGIGPGIERRLTELVTTGRLAELDELEREVEPQLVALGRYLGLGPQRMVAIGRALGVRTADELRDAARAGRLREAPGVGAATERKILEALSRERPERRRGVLLHRARALAEAIAADVGGEVAGEVRRWRDVVHELAVVSARSDAHELLAGSPTVVAIVEPGVGVTVEGIPVALTVATPDTYGTALLRATGAPDYVASLGPLPDAADEEDVYAALGLPWCPPELREAPLDGDPPPLVELADIRGDLHCHTTWSDGKATVEEMAAAARDLGYEYLAICDHTPNVRVVPGLDADALRAQGEEIAAANELLAPFRILRGTECDIRSDGTLDLPDDVLAELDWVQLSLHAGQRESGDRLTKKVTEAMRHPAVRCLSHPKGRIINHRPPNALDLERAIEVAREEGVALETNGLPDRLDLRDEEVRLAVEAGVPIVCSTDAHSVRGLANMALSVSTARRGWARAADVLNTRGRGPRASARLAAELAEQPARVGEPLAAQREPVRARVPVHRHERRRAQVREMVVRRRARNAGGLGELGERRVAGREPAEHAHAPLVGECPAQQERSVLEPAPLRHRVADDARAPVLAEEKPRPRGEVRHEDDGVDLRLGLVAVPPGRSVDELERGQPEAALRGRVARRRGDRAAVEHLVGEAVEHGEHAPLRLRRRQRQQHAERGPRLARVVAVVLEERRAAGGRRFERVRPHERPPGRDVDADEVAAQVRRGRVPDGAGDVVGTLEREPEQVEPELGGVDADALDGAAQLRPDRVELRHPAPRGAVGPGQRREADQELEAGACRDLGAERLRRGRGIVYEFRRTHSSIFER